MFSFLFLDELFGLLILMVSDNVCPSLPGSFYRAKRTLLLFIFVANGKVSSLHRGWMFIHGFCTIYSFKYTTSLLPFLSDAKSEVRRPSEQTPFSDTVLRRTQFLCIHAWAGLLGHVMFLSNFCTYSTMAIIYIKTTVCRVLHMPTPSLALSFVILVTAILIDIR